MFLENSIVHFSTALVVIRFACLGCNFVKSQALNSVVSSTSWCCRLATFTWQTLQDVWSFWLPWPIRWSSELDRVKSVVRTGLHARTESTSAFVHLCLPKLGFSTASLRQLGATRRKLRNVGCYFFNISLSLVEHHVFIVFWFQVWQ